LPAQIWRDRAAFDAWRNGNAFKAAHGVTPPASGAAAPAAAAASSETAAASMPDASSSSGGGPPAWTRPPRPVFYEATLQIVSPTGA